MESASVLVLTSLALRIFGSRRAARLAGLLAAVDPGLLVSPLAPARAALALFVLLSSAFLLVVAVDRPSSGCAAGAGAALALESLLLPAALVFAPVLATPAFDRRFPPAIRRVLAGSAAFGFALVFVPVAFANFLRSGSALSSGADLTSGGAFASAIQMGIDAARRGQAAALAVALWTIALAMLAILGWTNAERRGVRVAALAATVLALFVPLAAHVSLRYGPLGWHPVMTLYASAGLDRFVRRA